jgi:hypothetical protein
MSKASAMSDAVPQGADISEILRNPESLRRRARMCRQQARSTDHASLAGAFLDLAAALELAASAADMVQRRVVH